MSRQLSLSLVVLGSLLLAIPFHLRPENFVVDDGYFYPQIARFIVHGAGSTFNGIVKTNGYHPLWMGICVLAARITSSPEALIQILGTVQDLLLIGSLVLILNVAQTSMLRGAVLGCMPLLFVGMVLGIWRLLEANLALALQLCVLVLVLPLLPDLHRRMSGWRHPFIGLLLGLVLLARLDLVFFVTVVLLYELIRQDRFAPDARFRIAGWLVKVAIVGAVVAPYLAWNWKSFHHLVPISGAIKSSFPHVQPWSLAPYAYPVVGAILLNGALLFRRVRTGFETACLLTASAAALHLMYTLTFGGLAPWYLTTGYLTTCLCTIRVVDWLLLHIPRLGWMEHAVALLIFLTFLLLGSARLFSNLSYTRLRTGQFTVHGGYLEPKKALAKRLDETVPAGSRIMIFDAPGGVAFYSHMAVMPTDGLISDYAYNRDVVVETLAGYTTQRHIDYFIAPYLQEGQVFDRLSLQAVGLSKGQVMTVEAPLTHRSAGSITLTNADLILHFREINPDLETVYPEIGLWRIPHPDASRQATPSR